MEKLTLRDLDLQGKRVLMRVDFNVPLSKDGKIADDSRIEASLPSIRYVLKQGGRLILMSHLGRPDGKADPKCSLSICAKRLSELLGENVKMAPESVGPEVEKMALELKSGEVMLLENLRFHPGEEKPESEKGFVEGLAKLGQVYVNDAFGTAHRAHASTAKIASFFPGKAAAGFLMEKEVSMLGNLLQHPKKPFYAIIGGSKVSTKIGAIKNLLSRIDALFIGGGMAYTFLKAQGFRIGDSLCEEGEVKLAQQILAECKKKKIPCHLPIDLVIADAFSNEAARQIVDVYREQEGFVNLGSASQRKIDPNERDHCTSCKASEEDRFYADVASPNSQNLPASGIKEGIPNGWQGMGIGPKTVDQWSSEFKKAATIFWNGPLSVFEMPRFQEGTFAIAKSLSHLKITIVAGGGDSVAAIEKQGLKKSFSHLSTGGGASLEFLEFGHLPGIDALTNK